MLSEGLPSIPQVKSTEAESTPPQATAEDGDELPRVIQRLLRSIETGNVWQQELRDIKVKEWKVKQAEILKEIDLRILAYDNEMARLKKSRLEVELKAKFLECHFLTLYQELWILRDFQTVEERILQRIAVEQSQKNDVSLEVLSQKACAEAMKGEMKRLKEEIGSIDRRFGADCANTSFAETLKGIYDGNGSSVDCIPEGCDERLFNLTLALRNQKQSLEEKLEAERQRLDSTNATVEELKTRIRLVDHRLAGDEQELRKSCVSGRSKLPQIEI